MTQSTWKRSRTLFLFEMVPTLKGPLPWAALLGLGLLIIPVRFIFVGEFSVNGQLLGQELRLNYVLAVGYTTITFLTNLFALSLCMERTGNHHYLRNHDLLVLSRSLSRPIFYIAKLASVLIPTLVFAVLSILLFWEELYRIAGVNLFKIFYLIFPLSLSLACLVSLYFFMRHFLGNFMIFFLWLLLLPILYVANLWHYYGGALRAGSENNSVLEWLPQFGGIHAYSLGLVGDAFLRDDAGSALLNLGLWTVFAVGCGIFVFIRKRL
jgi:hypothetical protein